MKLLSSALLSIPLTLSHGWESLKFNKIPANTVEYKVDGLHISVDGSSSPLIYKLPQTLSVVRVEAEGTVDGTISLSDPKKQGLKGFDDLPLRLGLVLEGTKTLSWIEKKIAAEWIQKMHGLAPQGKGLDHVLFLEVVNDPSLIGIKRNHYLKDILKEDIVAFVDSQGHFKIDKVFLSPQKVMGLWLSSSGDHTPSKFKLHLKKIHLHTQK